MLRYDLGQVVEIRLGHVLYTGHLTTKFTGPRERYDERSELAAYFGSGASFSYATNAQKGIA